MKVAPLRRLLTALPVEHRKIIYMPSCTRAERMLKRAVERIEDELPANSWDLKCACKNVIGVLEDNRLVLRNRKKQASAAVS